MKPRTIFISIAVVLLAIPLGLWLASTFPTEQVGSRKDHSNVASGKATKVVTNNTAPTSEQAAQFSKADIEDGEPDVANDDLTLDEANGALTKLIGEVMPPSTRMVKPGHLEMASKDARILIERIELRMQQDRDGILNESKWIEFSRSETKSAYRPSCLKWKAPVAIPVGTVGFTMTPAWHGATIPRYDLWLDPATGLCVFSRMSNYDP